jgi:ABC-2 type transport system permease protein
MLAGYSVFGMVGASLFGIGVALSSELNAGWLELKRASPMPPVA